MNQREVFIDAIRQNPTDEVTRKVFADWLDEHDEPELADFMRSCTKEKLLKAQEFMDGLLKELNVGIDDDDDGYPHGRLYNRQSMQSLLQAGHDQIQNKAWEALPVNSWYYFSDHEDEYWEAWSLLTGTLIPSDSCREVPFYCCV